MIRALNPAMLRSVAVLALAVGWLTYIWWGHAGEAQWPVWVGSGAVLAAALAGALTPARPRAHLRIASALMLVLATFAGTRVVGAWPFAWDALPDARYAAVITLASGAIGVGLWTGSFWARWAALAFAGGAALGGLLNSYHLLRGRDEHAWLAAIGVLGGAVIAAQLTRPDVRAYVARGAQHAVWAQRDRLIATARWAAIANLAAAPMLILYALGQAVAPSTIVPALLLAPVLVTGSVLVIARRTLGIAVLAGAGLALLAHTAATLQFVTHASQRPIAGYYAAFWLPAALLGLVAGAIAFSRR